MMIYSASNTVKSKRKPLLTISVACFYMFVLLVHAPIVSGQDTAPPPETDDDLQDDLQSEPLEPLITAPTPADIWLNWRQMMLDELTQGGISPLTLSDRMVLRQGQQNTVKPAPQRAGNWRFGGSGSGAITLEFSRLGRLVVNAEGQERELSANEGLDLVDNLHISWTRALPYEDRALVFLHDRNHLGLRMYADLVQWYEYNADYRITGTFIAQESSSATYITNRAGITMVVFRIGIWQARWNGQDVRLSVFAERRDIDASSKIYILFTDESNGTETPRAGRYIDYLIYGDITDDLGLVIDFNYSVNPFCAVSSMISCPIINRNSVPVPVRAGEKLPTAKLPVERRGAKRRRKSSPANLQPLTPRSKLPPD